MTRERFQRAAEVLGKDTGVTVIEELAQKRQGTASSIASATGLHTATVMKHLGALAYAGILETRVVQGKTREMVEYILPSARIEMALDLSKKDIGCQDSSAEWDLISIVLDKSEKVYGEALDPPSTGKAYDLFLAMEKKYGRERAVDLFISAKKDMDNHNKNIDEILVFLKPFMGADQ